MIVKVEKVSSESELKDKVSDEEVKQALWFTVLQIMSTLYTIKYD